MLKSIKLDAPEMKATTNLTPLHAFVGRSGSGKTAMLDVLTRAFRTMSVGSGCGEFRTPIVLRFDDKRSVALPQPYSEAFLRAAAPINDKYPRLVDLDLPSLHGLAPAFDGWVNLNAVFDTRGANLAPLAASLMMQAPEAWQRVLDGARRQFPELENVHAGLSAGKVHLWFVFKGVERRCHASEAPESLVRYLYFLTLPLYAPTSIMLVEQPERGMHPAAIGPVIEVLRAVVAKGTQVVLATSSPRVIEQLKPEEVTFIARDPGTGEVTMHQTQDPEFFANSVARALS